MILRPKTCPDCGSDFVPNSGRQMRCDSCRKPPRSHRSGNGTLGLFTLPMGYVVPNDAVPGPGSPELGAATAQLVAAAGSVSAAIKQCALEEVEYRRRYPGALVSKYVLVLGALQAFPGK